MPSIADVFLRLRIDKNQVKNDVQDGVNKVDTSTAGKRAGKQYGDNFAKNAAEQITLKRALIGTAITAALAVGPAGLATGVAFAGVGIAVALTTAIITQINKDRKSVQTELDKLLKIKNPTASDKQQIAQLQQELALINQQARAYDQVRNAATGVKETLLRVFTAALANSGILRAFTASLNQVGAWFSAHRGMFTAFFAAAAPYVPIVTHFFERLIATLLPQFTHLMNVSRPAVQKVLDALIRFTRVGIGGFLNQMGHGALASAGAFGHMLVALSPLLPAIGRLATLAATLLNRFPQLIPIIGGFVIAVKIAKSVDALAKSFTTVKESLIALKITSATIPWIAVATLIVTAAVLIITHWKTVKTFFVKLWHDIYGGFIAPMINWFTKSLPHAFQLVVTWIRTHWVAVAGLLGGPVALAVAAIIRYWGPIGGFFARTWNWIYAHAFGPMVHFFTATLPNVWRAVTNAVVNAWNAIGRFFASWWGRTLSFFSRTLDALRNGLANAWHAISSALVNAWNAIGRFFASWWGRTINFFGNSARTVRDGLSTVWNAISRTAVNVWSDIGHFFSRWWSDTKNTAVSAAGWIRDHVAAVWNSISRTAKNVWHAIGGFMSAGINDGKRALANAINFVTQDILNPMIRGYNAINNIWSGADVNQIPAVHFRAGGKVNSGTTETADDVLIRVSKNETILSAMHSRILAPALAALGVPGYAKGGAVSVGMYRNPLGRVSGLRPERIDQGVDFAGAGPVGAIGRAVINLTNGGGWPGGPFMSYRLQDGPLAGRNVFLAENIHPVVRAGQTVKAGQTIANMFNGGTGIEMGFADGSGARTLARVTSGYREGQVTPAGKAFEQLLRLLGVPESPSGPGGGLAGLPNAGPGGGSVISPAQQKAFAAYIKLLNKDIGLYSPEVIARAVELHPGGLPKVLTSAGLQVYRGTGGNAAKKIKPVVQNLYNQAQTAAAGPSGSAPAGGATGGEMANGRELYQYLLKNVFAGHKIAAAGAIASIWGESTWNPFAQGTGGRGLIGWTPPGTISDANFRGGMRTQLPAIVRFISTSGDWGVISRMKNATSVLEAANLWGRGVERFGINDVHATGLALAKQIAGLRRGGKVSKLGRGGTISEPVVGIGASGGTYVLGESGDEDVIPGSAMAALIAEVRALRAEMASAPARTAAGVGKAINGQKGMEAQNARLGAR